MKIGQGQALGGLFERIESAYQDGLSEARGEPTAAGAAASATKRPARVAPSQAAGASPSVEAWEQLENSVQRNLLKLCSDAIGGRIESEDKLRNGVVRTIVSQRYSEGLPAEQTERIMETLGAMLTTDPTFRESIEHLLLLAARELS